MSSFIEQTGEHRPLQWEQIRWGVIEANVRRLQERIYRATEHQGGKKVRRLQTLLVRAMSNHAWRGWAGVRHARNMFSNQYHQRHGYKVSKARAG